MAKIKNPLRKKPTPKKSPEIKPLSTGEYASLTAKQRAAAKAAARKAFDNGQITEAQANVIVKRVNDANSPEARRAAKIEKNKDKGDLDVDTVVKQQVVKANKAKSKREANEAAGKKAKAKTKAKDSGDISEVLMPEDRPSKDAEVQTSRERLINATGAISAMLTKAGPKPLSMDKYRSLPTRIRNSFGRQASSDYDRGIITKSEYETIIKRIEAAELYKGVRLMEQGIANKKANTPTLDNSMALAETKGPKKSTDMSKSELAEKLREQEAAAKPKLSKGGMTKKKAYSRGGLTTGAKSRTGHTDMRKGGLFK